MIADDVASDISLQNNNSLNNVLVITKTTEYGQVEANQHDVNSPQITSEKLTQAIDEFPKPCLWRTCLVDTMNIHSECRI